MENKTYLYDQFPVIKNSHLIDFSKINAIEMSGLVLTLLLSKFDKLNINTDDFLRGLQNLADEMEKYTYKTDDLVKNLVKKQYFGRDDMIFMEHMVLLKTTSKDIIDYVTLLLNNNPSDYENLVFLSINFYKNIMDFFNITLTLDIDDKGIESCFDYLRLGLSMILNDFKSYIIINHDKYLYPKEEVQKSPHLLGYMISSFKLLEDIQQYSPTFELVPMNFYNFPPNISDMVAAW